MMFIVEHPGLDGSQFVFCAGNLHCCFLLLALCTFSLLACVFLPLFVFHPLKRHSLSSSQWMFKRSGFNPGQIQQCCVMLWRFKTRYVLLTGLPGIIFTKLRNISRLSSIKLNSILQLRTRSLV